MTESTQPPQFTLEGMITIDTAGRVNTSGAFCDLFSGRHPIAGKVALKRPRDTNYTGAMLKLIMIEAGVWIKLNHPRILKFLGLYTVNEVIYFVSPFAEFGSLPSYLQSFPNADRGRLVLEIAEGLAYLHQFEPAIVHGDVKGNNVLVASDHQARLCDFGLARHVDAHTVTALKGAGSTAWQSPEILRGDPKSLQSDVYAFGITIYEVLSGKVPYSNHPTIASIVTNVLMFHLRPPLEPLAAPDGTPYLRFWDSATRCWTDSPAERPFMADVLQDLSKIVMFTAGLLTVETDWGAVHIDSRDATIGPDPTVDQSIYNKVKFTRTSMMLNTGVFDQKFTIPFLLMTCDEKIDITIKHGRDKSRHEDNLGQATALFGQNSYTSSYNPRDIIENPKSFRDCKVDVQIF